MISRPVDFASHRRPAGRRRRPRDRHPRHGVRPGGRRGRDPLRGAAPRRDAGSQHPLHPPGRRGGDLADHAAPARRAAPGRPLRPGVVGAVRRRRRRRRPQPLARPLGGRVSTTTTRPTERAHKAMPSPFPPIEDFAFLSDCHTGALVAPDGGIGWLCVPRFDAPSVFGTLLDREAGYFRLGPFGVNVPTARAYEPGTNILITTWNTPGGWVEVRDALTMGPSRGDDEVTPHTRPPADDDADHTLVRTAVCIEGEVEIQLVCEP